MSPAPASGRVPGGRPRLLYLVTDDWYFCSHRLELARAAREAGFDVAVATREQGHGDAIRDEGFRLEPVGFRRGARLPGRDLRVVAEIARVYRRLRPRVAHHVSLKPVVLGSLAAAAAPPTITVNALTGLGHVFTGVDRRAALLRRLVGPILGRALDRRGSVAVFQNPDDLEECVGRGLVRAARTRLVRGSGVDTARFRPTPAPPGVPVVALASRMLRDKGVPEFVAAARILRSRGVAARARLVGGPDPENPTSLSRETLEGWCREGVVEWLGHREDMPGVLSGTHVVCLPSHREGLPKVLLEASACARPVVATDVPGCREIVRDGENGLLVPARDPTALADALERLARDPDLRESMGRAGRRLVEGEFSLERVIERTLALYGSPEP